MSGTQTFNDKNQFQEQRGFRNPLAIRQTHLLGADEKRNVLKKADVLLIDMSGSTIDPIGYGDNRQKIIGIKESTTAFIGNLPATSFIAVFAFDGLHRLLYSMAPVGANKLQIIQQIQRLQPGSTTAMENTLIASEKEFMSVPQDYTKRLFLLTDGIPDTDPREAAESIKQKGVQLYTIGFGDGLQIDSNLLSEMASKDPSGKSLYFHFKDSKNLTGFMTRMSKRL